jgi:NADH-quinone oxidoreductase subunit C
MEDHGSPLLRRLLDALPASVTGTHAELGDATAIVRPEELVSVMRFLRDAPGLEFEMLADATAVDYLGESPRFEVVYHLYSLTRNHRLRVKLRVGEEKPEVDSLIPVWPAANWLEREIWDMYGIRFRGHPDLRRLLLYEEFEGHPLRKDYPKEKRQPLVGPRN